MCHLCYTLKMSDINDFQLWGIFWARWSERSLEKANLILKLIQEGKAQERLLLYLTLPPWITDGCWHILSPLINCTGMSVNESLRVFFITNLKEM